MPTRIIIPIGTRFGKLVVQGLSEKRGNHGQVYWNCLCDCGNTAEVTTGKLRAKEFTRSCGCLVVESIRSIALTHGMTVGRTTTPEYAAWLGAKQRCYDKGYRRFADYGGRGIVICQRWLASPEIFVKEVGVRPSKTHSLDRKDNDGNYSCGKCDECLANGWPMNVRWATRKEQAGNTRRSTWLVYKDQRMILADWARFLFCKGTLLSSRKSRGWSDEKTLTTPIPLSAIL